MGDWWRKRGGFIFEKRFSPEQKKPILTFPRSPAGQPLPRNSEDFIRILIILVVVAGAIFIGILVVIAFVFSTGRSSAHNFVVAATAQQPDAGTIVVIYEGGQGPCLVFPSGTPPRPGACCLNPCRNTA